MSWSFAKQGLKSVVVDFLGSLPDENAHQRFVKETFKRLVEDAPPNMHYKLSASGHHDHTDAKGNYNGNVKMEFSYKKPEPPAKVVVPVKPEGTPKPIIPVLATTSPEKGK